MPRRENRGTRRAERRVARPRILVVCGAARTEEAYLKGLRHSVANLSVDLTVVNRPKDPLDVVGYAVDYPANVRADFDETWCVFDVDEFDVGPALRLARDHGIQVAVSNPCFELWLLLHLDDCRAHVAPCDRVVDRLRRHLPAYDKTRPRFADFATGVPAAVARAEALEPADAVPDSVPNPSTGVWRLVKKIME